MMDKLLELIADKNCWEHEWLDEDMLLISIAEGDYRSISGPILTLCRKSNGIQLQLSVGRNIDQDKAGRALFLCNDINRHTDFATYILDNEDSIYARTSHPICGDDSLDAAETLRLITLLCKEVDQTVWHILANSE